MKSHLDSKENGSTLHTQSLPVLESSSYIQASVSLRRSPYHIASIVGHLSLILKRMKHLNWSGAERNSQALTPWVYLVNLSGADPMDADLYCD
jgi:hypothetical protein